MSKQAKSNRKVWDVKDDRFPAPLTVNIGKWEELRGVPLHRTIKVDINRIDSLLKKLIGIASKNELNATQAKQWEDESLNAHRHFADYASHRNINTFNRIALAMTGQATRLHHSEANQAVQLNLANGFVTSLTAGFAAPKVKRTKRAQILVGDPVATK